MPRSPAAWIAEIQAHVPQGSDLIELARSAPELSAWRAALADHPDERECLRHWEAFVRDKRIAVVLEQVLAPM